MDKNLDYYMSLQYSYKITPDPDLGFYIEIPDLPGCRGDGNTIDEAIEDIMETKQLWLELALKKGYEIPVPSEAREYSGQFLLRMPKALHRSIAEEAKLDNVSMNHYLTTLITENRHIKAVARTREIVDQLNKTLLSASLKFATQVAPKEEPAEISLRQLPPPSEKAA